uniref:AN1-type domain-containing protein n=1 Tax=viral metagenome TaxID=1070528 RepID=A0A6C0FFB8_9ZZZZ|tara:strand:- start:81 stop:347 length:267 start_codon:yes stop_codon:yes gene_type:complete
MDTSKEPLKQTEIKESNKTEKKSKSERCQHPQCKKKLKMMSFTCKCGLKFCVAHQNPHSHNCSYDYKTEKCKLVEQNNPKLGSKMVKI